MMGRSSSFLGVAVSDRSLTCAEVAVQGDRRTVRRTATFTFPQELSLEAPEAAGQALATFLRENRFAASRAVVGIPARWLLAVEKEIPPSDEDQARAVLRLQGERLALAESNELVFDFAGRPDAAAATKVLLVGVHRQRLERVQQMMRAANLSVAAVTSTGLALAAATVSAPGREAGVLLLGRGGGEMIWSRGETPRMLRHVSFTQNGHGMPAVAPLGAELRRAVAMVQPNGDPAGRQVMLLDGVGLPDEKVEELSQRLGVSITSAGELAALKLDSAPDAFATTTVAATGSESAPPPLAGVAPAMSQAIAASRPGLLAVDFLHPRLAPIRTSRFGRKGVWAAVLGAVAVLALGNLFYTVKSRESELAGLEKRLADQKEEVAAAQAVVDQLRYGRGFFETRTPVLDALQDVTMSFRDQDRIWTTAFTLRENGRGTLGGKAANQQTVFDVLDQMKASGKFADAKLQYAREADQRSREVAFSISFELREGAAGATTAPTTAASIGGAGGGGGGGGGSQDQRQTGGGRRRGRD